MVFLIVAAMLLINVVIVRLAERDLIRAKLDSGRLLVRAVEQNLTYFLQSGAGRLSEIREDLSFQKGMSRLLAHGGFSDVVIIDADGEKLFHNIRPLFLNAREQVKIGFTDGPVDGIKIKC